MQNSDQQHVLTKNTTYLSVALILQKILSLFYFTVLGRNIPAADLGAYIFALTYAGIFGIFIDMGLGPVLTREVARSPEKANKYFSAILGLKLILSVLSIVALYVVFHFLQGLDFLLSVPPRTEKMVYVSILIILLDSFTFTFYSLFRARQKIHYEALAVIVYQIIIVGFGLVFLFLDKPVIYYVGAVLLGSVFNFLYSFILLIRKGGLVIGVSFDWSMVKMLLQLSIPFALAGIFFKLTGSLDQTMLGFLAGERYVGWYGVAFKLTFALTVLPGAFATSFFPVMSRLYSADPRGLARIFERAMFYLMVMSLPITIGIWVVGKDIVLALYKQAYVASADALYIFALGLVFVFLNYPVGNLLNAAHRQVRNTVHMGIALVVNVVLNLMLIPRNDRFGTYIGATIAAVISSIVLICLGLPVVGRIVQYNRRYLLSKFFQILAASASMGGVLWILKSSVPLLFLVLLGPVLYLFFLVITRSMTIFEMKRLVSTVLKKVS